MIVVIIIDVITIITVIVDESIIMTNVIDAMITMIDGIIMTGIISNNNQNASQINPLAVAIEVVVAVEEDEVVDLNRHHERLIMPMPSRASI